LATVVFPAVVFPAVVAVVLPAAEGGVVAVPAAVVPVVPEVVAVAGTVDAADAVVTGVVEPSLAAPSLVSDADGTGPPGESSDPPSSRSTTRPSPMANTTMAMPPTATRIRRNRSSPAGSPPIGGSGA
jgi:hypothetical protein